MFFFFFKQKTAYEMRISDWISDVCSSDLERPAQELHPIRRVKAAQTAAWLVSLDEDRHAAIEIMQCVPAFPRLSSPRAHASIRIVTCCARHCAARSRCH